MINLEILLNLRDFFTNVQPFVVVFNALIGLIIGSITLYLLIKAMPRKIKSSDINSGTFIINWSGHPLPEADWTKECNYYEPKKQPFFNVKSWETLQDSVRLIIKELPKDLQLRLLHGNRDIIIVIPQLAAGLSILLATIHGRTGSFPSITSPLRNSEGKFWLPAPVNLGDVRLNSRLDRQIET